MPSNLQKAYSTVKEVAAPSASEGLKKERAILLLWFLRHVYGIDDLEAYEFVCDGDNDQGIDGLYLEAAEPDENQATLHVFQSRYPEGPKNVGVNDIKQLIGTLEPLATAQSLTALVSQGVEPELGRLITRFELVDRLTAGQLRAKGILVTAGKLTPQARALIENTNSGRKYPYLTAYDVLDLAPMVEAFRSPTTVKAEVAIGCAETERFICDTPQARIAVCRVPVSDIVKWPGILDRTLFDLNVRRELGKNRVRHALDSAVRRKADHPNFLAYHNGLTVVCSSFDASDPQILLVKDLSVVNGAQSTIAFKDNEAFVTKDLSVVVKFVEVSPDAQLAREVAVRSNTQNPVNARNLRARDGIQLRLVQEFKDQYPDTVYETRPDASLQQQGVHVIQNDVAAQLLTAVFHQRPWLAVKRLSLFEADTYPEVFTPEIAASHIMLADLISQRVQEAKSLFPEEYRRSWRLTQLVATYLVGQMLRTDDAGKALLHDPKAAMSDIDSVHATVDQLVKVAAATLKVRHDSKNQQNAVDDFKVDFKRESELKELARKARDHYLVASTMQS